MAAEGGTMKEDPKGYQGDLAFMEWVRNAPVAELQAQHKYAVDWQRVAIEREMAKRHAR